MKSDEVTSSEIEKLAGQISTLPLGAALRLVSQIDNRADFEEVGSLLASIGEKTGNANAQYCAGQIFFDLGDDLSALRCFTTAGNSGIGSASYRAAMILKGLGKADSSTIRNSPEDVNRLLENAAQAGHVFGRLSLMRAKKKSPLGYVQYLLYRFIYGPAQILVLGLFRKDSDKIRI